MNIAVVDEEGKVDSDTLIATVYPEVYPSDMPPT
jgi:hypothetical protein